MTVTETTTGPIHVTKRGRVLEVRIERGKAKYLVAHGVDAPGNLVAGMKAAWKIVTTFLRLAVSLRRAPPPQFRLRDKKV